MKTKPRTCDVVSLGAQIDKQTDRQACYLCALWSIKMHQIRHGSTNTNSVSSTQIGLVPDISWNNDSCLMALLLGPNQVDARNVYCFP